MISQNKLADNIMKETKIHDLIPDDVVLTAKDYIINQLGGFEKFAEYGLI